MGLRVDEESTSSAKNRPQTTAEIFAHEGGVAFLSEYEKANLKNYQKVLVKKFGKAFAPRAACQLNQSADDWPMHSKVSGSMEYLHTMIKNVGVLFCKDRGITVNEMAMYPGCRSGLAGGTQSRSCLGGVNGILDTIPYYIPSTYVVCYHPGTIPLSQLLLGPWGCIPLSKRFLLQLYMEHPG